MFGVSAAFRKELAKRVQRDHALASALWASGNHDAMNCAARIADPSTLTDADAEADRWLAGVRSPASSGSLSDVVGRSPVGLSRAKAWMADPAEYTRACGYGTLGICAARLMRSYRIPLKPRTQSG